VIDVICRYTRSMAIRGGVLFDATDAAREAGFRCPVALTAAAWEKCVRVPHGVAGQDEAGRLRAVLAALCRAARTGDPGATELHFKVTVRNNNRCRNEPPHVRLKAVSVTSDEGDPAVTVLLREEDQRCNNGPGPNALPGQCRVFKLVAPVKRRGQQLRDWSMDWPALDQTAC
jgi:hypothetical protein